MMGYLTTITVYNDQWHDTKQNPKKFVENIDKFISKGRMDRFDYAVNQTKVHKTRHADDHTVYVHTGNTVVDTDSYGNEMQRVVEEFPDFFDQIVNVLERQVKELKDLKKRTRK